MVYKGNSHSKFQNFTFAAAIVLLVPALYLYYICRTHPELFNDKHGFDLSAGPFLGFDNCPERNYTKITLTGNSHQDDNSFILAKEKLKELVLSKDTINGVCFEFGKKSNYSSFIRAIDIIRSIDMCKSDRPWLYMVDDNFIWVLNTSKSDGIAFEKALKKEFGDPMTCE